MPASSSRCSHHVATIARSLPRYHHHIITTTSSPSYHQ
jgi:hypothetical protein